MLGFKKYIALICSIMLVVLPLSMLLDGVIGDVVGKYITYFDFDDAITIEKATYTVTYMNEGNPLHSFSVTSGQGVSETELSVQHKIAQDALEDQIDGNANYDGYTFNYWMNAGSSEVISIADGNTEDIVLYPSFVGVYTAMYVNQTGEILYWTLFEKDADGWAKVKALESDATNAAAIEKFDFDYWEVQMVNEDGNLTKTPLDSFDVNNVVSDITIYPYYSYSGDVKLIPIDEDQDGDTDYYQVGGYGNDEVRILVEIPNDVNGIPVTTINADAFSSYDDLHSIRIPANITEINSQAFTANQGSSWNPKRDTVTLYYEGDPAYWATAMTQYNNDDYSGMLKQNWDNNMGEGSRVFFLVNGKVDETKGYWELDSYWSWGTKWVWQFHSHPFPYDSSTHDCDYDHHQNDTDYDGACNCDSCNGATRPDAGYWTTTTE